MKAIRMGTVAVGVLAVVGGSVVWAQAPYAGVVPGSGQEPPRAAVARRAEATVLTWPGFQMLADGRSRFFVQSTTPVPYQVIETGGRTVLLFRDARFHLRNTRLPLETRFFDTPVARARLERRGRDVAFVLEHRPGAAPVPIVRTEAAPPYHFVHVEYPAGEWIPADERVPVAPPRPARLSEQEQRELEALDDEPPPDLGEVGPAGR